jgi:hypothetical protein
LRLCWRTARELQPAASTYLDSPPPIAARAARKPGVSPMPLDRKEVLVDWPPLGRSQVRDILEAPGKFRWTVQGFGFLRCYPGTGKRLRLNVWDNRLTLPHVSTIHDHPWQLTSWIFSGTLMNHRYLEVPRDQGTPYWYAWLRTGEGGGLEHDGEATEIWLEKLPLECYKAGDLYSQEANEIHRTAFQTGTVTLNERIGDTERARVFWDQGERWYDAMPREATTAEIDRTISYALKKWKDFDDR